MLIDMHAHSSGISRCCRATAEEVLRTAQAAGIDGLVLSNHYDGSYAADVGGALPFARMYVEEYFQAKAHADAMGMKLFFGVEVTARKHNNAHILLYGVTPDFVLAHPDVYDYTLEEMHTLVSAAGGLVVQAHPYRSGGHVLDTDFLHGVEVNCHPLYDATHCGRLQEVARNAQLLLTCGGDYHADVPYRPVCGVHFPDEAQTWAELIAHLTATPVIRLHVHELRTAEHADVEFARS